ncbi:hypothetical protein MMC18_009615 [Xylographa bjoerkii]|nr:hypothetical protein [Xylographa bjoerkii]
MARGGCDAIAFKIARVLRHLLAIEAQAASGTIYSTNSSQRDKEELECYGKLANNGKGLYVYILYFGTLYFERHATSKPVSAAPTAPEQDLSTTLTADMRLPDQLGDYYQQLPFGPDCPPASQIDSHAQIVQSQFGQLASPRQLPSTGNDIFGFGGGDIQEGQLAIPVGFAGANDNWDLQGVDVALFDSLFRGTAIPDAVEEETWMQWASNR